jgi:carbon monoxide dehydrogenase subunit G
MLIEEKFSVKAPIQKVWDFLLNPESIGPCIPGCEGVEAINEKEFVSGVKIKVGPIAVRFKFKTTIEEIVPYTYIRATGGGDESDKKGHFKQQTTINFNKLSEEETEVWYRSDVSVVGRIATFGERIMRAKAKELGKEFTSAVKSKLE